LPGDPSYGAEWARIPSAKRHPRQQQARCRFAGQTTVSAAGEQESKPSVAFFESMLRLPLVLNQYWSLAPSKSVYQQNLLRAAYLPSGLVFHGALMTALTFTFIRSTVILVVV
jgi:hypothetical protein